jgi:hypothetical protein
VLFFGKILLTSLATKTKAVLADLLGPGSSFDLQHPEADQGAERALKQPLFGALGIIARPRQPAKLRDGSPVHAEYAGQQDGGGITAIAYRDLRLNEQYPAPAEGTIALVGYGGGRVELADAGTSGDQKVSRITITVPYQISAGTPAKTHAITIDPDGGTITVQHGDGLSVTIGSSEITLGTAAGSLPVARANPLVSYLGALEAVLNTLALAIDNAAGTTGANVGVVSHFVSDEAPDKANVASHTTNSS